MMNKNILVFYLYRHLNSSNLTKISRPTLLITDALNTKYSQGQRKTKDAQLLSTMNIEFTYGLFYLSVFYFLFVFYQQLFWKRCDAMAMFLFVLIRLVVCLN
jgi:hypothetical protein